MIPFNKAVYFDSMKSYVGEVLESSKIAGDGEYARRCAE